MAKSISAGLPKLQGVLDGLSFGFGDEMLAGLEAAGRDGLNAVGIEVADIDYDTALKENRAAQKKFEDENPGTALGMNFIGSIPWFFVPGGNIVKAGSLMAKFGRGAAQGGASGFLGGFGEGEGGDGPLVEQMSRRATSGLFSGGAGAVLGSAAPVAGRGLEMLGRKIFKGEPFSEQSANRILSRDLDDAGKTPDSVRQGLREMREDNITKPLALADVGGPSVLNSVERGAARQGPGMAQARQLLEDRQLGRSARLKDDFRAEGAVDNPFDLAKEINARRKAEADPLYRETYQTPRLTAGRAVELVEDYPEDFAAVWPKARQMIIRAQKRKDPSVPQFDVPEKLFEEVSPGQGVLAISHPAEFDFLQRAFKDKIKKANTSESGLGATERGQLTSIHRELTQAMDDEIVTPGGRKVFKDVRAMYAGDSEALDAITAGRKFLSRAPEEIKDELEEIQSKAGRDAYMAGAVRALEDSISKRKDPATSTVFRTDNMDKLRALAFGISGSMEEGASMFARLKRRIGLERKMASTEAAVLGGSPTARRMPDPREGVNSTAAELAVQGGDLGLPPGFGIAMSKLSSGIGDEYRRAVDGQIARKALDSDPMALSALLRQLESLNSVPARVVEQYMGGPAGGSVVGQQVPGLLRDE